MKVRRIVEVDNVNVFEVGDQIDVGKYTATAMKEDGDCMLFCLDQYLDKTYTHEKLIEKMNRDLLADKDFSEFYLYFHKRLVPFGEENGIDELRKKYQQTSEETGYLFRVPYAGEIFMGTSEEEWVCENIEPDYDGGFYERWTLMKDRRNRIASRKEECECGWLMNKRKNSAAYFAYVSYYGYANYHYASNASFGVRPVFRIRNR